MSGPGEFETRRRDRLVTEFTGERVIPGEVNDDLWAEHIARYAFASSFAVDPSVLDLGCGAGYGAAEVGSDQGASAGRPTRSLHGLGADFRGRNVLLKDARVPRCVTDSLRNLDACQAGRAEHGAAVEVSV